MSTIEIENVGPITSLSIPVPKEGGVVVLQGPNGKGKTTALEAVAALSKGRPPGLRDGTKKGRIEGLGVKINVGLSSRRSGELEVQSLEGRLDVSDLVDPGIASPEAADARRIKALIALSGVECRADMFAPLVEGGMKTLEELVPPSKLQSADILEVAAAVKRAIEAEARKVEGQSETEAGRAKGLYEQAGDLPEHPECDEAEARERYEAAVKTHSELIAKRQTFEKMCHVAAEAKSRLKEALDNEPVDSIDSLTQRILRGEDAIESADAKLKELELQIESERTRLSEATRTVAALRADLQRVEEHQRRCIALQESIEIATAVPSVSSDEIETASVEKEYAADLIGRIAAIREGQKKRQAAATAKQQALMLAKKSETLRQAAAGTDEILTDLVSGLNVPLEVKVIEGRTRLVTNTSRGPTYFGDLSAGERWRIGLDVAIEAVGPRGLLTIRQEAWEGLDPENRQAICEHVRARGVVLLTAEATGGTEIVPEVQS